MCDMIVSEISDVDLAFRYLTHVLALPVAICVAHKQYKGTRGQSESV